MAPALRGYEAASPASAWPGQTISHYRVEERLGAGGMGEVYLAVDLALGRQAALKLLPHNFSAALRGRLVREAAASARLQHPGIATFYEGGEHEGTTFLAMEYVPGQTLRERLAAGALPLDQALAVTACLLEALGHAHAAGIVHRDIKPENIMLTGERSAKLLDFGLAKPLFAGAEIPLVAANSSPGSGSPESAAGEPALSVTEEYVPTPEDCLHASTADGLTGADAIVGTIGYISPEQLSGQVDARSDLFLVGAVLYEMITGERAFRGKTPGERIAATLHNELPRLSGSDIPAGLVGVLARSLARDPDDRYPSAGAFLSELRRVSAVAATAALPDTVAVLDFRNLSQDPADDWLGHGIAEGLVAQMVGLPGLRLVPRPKVLGARAAFAGTDQEFGLHLGCRWLVCGTVAKAGMALNVLAQLIEVPTGQQVAEERIDGPADQLFALQEQLAARLAARLKAERPVEAAVPASPLKYEAYECYTRGRQLFLRFQKDAYDQAQELLERAVRIDPSYAPALANLAAVHALRFPFTTDPQTLELAIHYARRAIEADPHLDEPHIWIGYALSSQGDILGSFLANQQAMALASTHFMASYFAAGALQFLASGEEARQSYEVITGKPCAQDPHRWLRSEAVKLYQRSLAINPRFPAAWVGLGTTHLDLNNVAEARWCLEKMVDLDRQVVPGAEGSAGYLGECLRRSGALAEARTNCLASLESIEKSDHIYRDTNRGFYLCALGRTLLQQGDGNAAHAAFTQAVQQLRGRARARAGGQVLVQALAGASRSGEGLPTFEEALNLFQCRQGFDFQPLWWCTDDVALLELARAARTLGRTEQARHLLQRARDAGSAEALYEETT